MRTRLAAGHLSQSLRRDPTARAMVFCVDQEHADDMRSELVRANPDLVAGDPEWVVRIVGSEPEKTRLLRDFTDPESDSPVVATTSRLLSTGVDVQDLKYVVLFRPVGSMVEFKQIVGRGSRLFPDKGKTSFEIIDYVGATRHFSDPAFDGDPELLTTERVDGDGDVVEITVAPVGSAETGDLVAEPAPEFQPTEGQSDGEEDLLRGHPRRKLYVDDGAFSVVAESTHVPDTSTGQLRLTEYAEYVAGQVRLVANSASELAQRWSSEPSRGEIVAALERKGISLAELVGGDGWESCDPLDVLVHLAWNVAPRTRAERARRARESHHEELEELTTKARATLSGLLERYAAHGIDDMTSVDVLRMEPLRSLGSSVEIARAFGGADAYHRRVDDLQSWLYSA